jgi:DNA modification methylase
MQRVLFIEPQKDDAMRTTHKIVFENANNMKEIEDNSIDFMVTSPPYPMIEMWDEIFSYMKKGKPHVFCNSATNSRGFSRIC